jgi:hypothetical protein
VSLPKKVKVGSTRYTVRATEDALMRAEHLERSGLSGHTDYDELVITVDPKLAADRFAEVLLHETLHATFEHCGLGYDLEGQEDGLEEQVVRRLAPALLGVLRDNPKLVRFLIQSAS